MTLSQWFLSLIILFIIYRTLVTYKKENLSVLFLSLWILLWVIALFFIVDLSALIRVANFFGIGRGVDFAIYICILALFYCVYRIFIILERRNRAITKLVREIAIMNAKRKGVSKRGK